ncbi:GIY-YIG nuclease family protein [Marinomonas mediterranea]|uniref:GIY-YIG nuclease family protein n=1 Tax=Marinomonas mediterranea TaxID=119864 RepID=UPI00234920B2|nr:GIY-YIG nuclease family protein [Marinomonas mediterranea]WCN10305.1 GIY-YIG nuclease family protein [Marinomonas mediterranea]
MNDWSLYLVRTCMNTLYTGITTDVERRFLEHCSGGPKGARYLRGKGPLSLVWYEQVGSRSEASKLEYRVKKLCKSDKERLAAGLISLDVLLKR